MLAVFRREFKAYFTSPIGFVFVGLFIFIAGVFFALTNLLGPNMGNPDFRGVLSSLTFIFGLFLVPLLTMRLLSEERRQKTDQLLITSPLSITGIVIGKYLAAIAVFAITLLITVLFPFSMSFFSLLGLGWWEILGSYIGFLLMGCAFISIGLFFSSITENQLIAAVTTFAAFVLIWILDAVTQVVPSDSVSGLIFLAALGAALVALVWFGTRSLVAAIAAFVLAAAAVALLFVFSRSFFPGLIAKILTWFSLVKRNNDFTQGILGLSPIVYYISFTGAFIFLTIRIIDKRRWV
jgi:ABC-2 type transport system permease protein